MLTSFPQPSRILRHRKATAPQRAFWTNDARYRAFVGGVGSGKTRAGAVEVLRMPPLSTGMVIAPTYPMLRDATLMTFLDLARRGGVLSEFKESTLTARLIDGKSVMFRSSEHPDRLRGPNLGWFWLDEAAMMDEETWLIMLGRLREAPGRAWVTSTPKGYNWLYESFVKHATADHVIIRASTTSNLFLPSAFVPALAQSYSGQWYAQEVEGEFTDTAPDRFLPSILWWDACREALPPLDAYTPIVLGVDAGVSNDTFGLVGVSRHPARHEDVAVRLVRNWVPKGSPLDFNAIQKEIEQLCDDYRVLQITFDAYQLHQMMSSLGARVWTDAFSQQGERLTADKQLLDLIQSRRIAHDGNADLRQHLDNADRQVDTEAHKLRIVKRKDDLKVDLAVCTSQAAKRVLDLNV